MIDVHVISISTIFESPPITNSTRLRSRLWTFLILLHTHPNLLLSDSRWEMTLHHYSPAVVRPHRAEGSCCLAEGLPGLLPGLASVAAAVSQLAHLADVEEQPRQRLPWHYGRIDHRTSNEQGCNGLRPRRWRTRLCDHLQDEIESV